MLTASVILKWNHNYQVPSRKTDASLPRCRTISSGSDHCSSVTILCFATSDGAVAWDSLPCLRPDCVEMYSHANNQQTMNTSKNDKSLAYIFEKPSECYGVPKVHTLVCVLFWQFSSLICLLTEILISWYLDLPEWDFSHRGVVQGSYLNGKGRRNFQWMSPGSDCQGELCYKTGLLFGL